MWPLIIVVDHPRPDDVAHLLKIGEQVGARHFASERPVELFDVGVLVRLAGLDLQDCYVVVGAPGQERIAQQFRTVIAANRFRHTTPAPVLIQDAQPVRHSATCRSRSQRLSDAFAHHV